MVPTLGTTIFCASAKISMLARVNAEVNLLLSRECRPAAVPRFRSERRPPRYQLNLPVPDRIWLPTIPTPRINRLKQSAVPYLEVQVWAFAVA